MSMFDIQIQLAWYLFVDSAFYLKEFVSFHLVCIPLSCSESFQRVLLQQLQTRVC